MRGEDVVFGLSLFVIGLTLWVLIPLPIRQGLRAGFVPLALALAEAVRAVARPAWRWTYAGLCRLYGVKDFQPAPARPAPLPPPEPADRQTDRLADALLLAQTTPPTAADALRVDRTRTALIAVLVDSGWSVSEIRAVVKGDNTAISAEVAAATNARAELHTTPIAKRPTSGKFQQA